MTVVVTRDVAQRFRGFLTSCMLEIAPGVYVQPTMSSAVRERVWRVLEEWHQNLSGTVVMTWSASQEPGRLGVRILGEPPKELVEYDAFVLCRNDRNDAVN
jgi:CRISPR-associated protein Cas2